MPINIDSKIVGWKITIDLFLKKPLHGKPQYSIINFNISIRHSSSTLRRVACSAITSPICIIKVMNVVKIKFDAGYRIIGANIQLK